MTGCAVCAKHRGEGPLVGPVITRGELVIVTHHPVEPVAGTVVPGYLFVEPRRHVAHLPQLTAAESDALAAATRRIARALAAEFGTDLVMTAVAGLSVPHLHQHVSVRHPGTPADVPWFPPDRQVPRVDAGTLAELCRRLTAAVDRDADA